MTANSDYQALQAQFWQGFLAYLATQPGDLHDLYRGKKPHGNEINTPLVKPGVKLKLFLNSRVSDADGRPSYAAQIYIDAGNVDINKAIFHALHADRAAIEAEVGVALEWRRMDDDRASRIVYRAGWDGNLYDEIQWSAMYADLHRMGQALVTAFRDRLSQIEVKV